jgi:hypothetical protein
MELHRRKIPTRVAQWQVSYPIYKKGIAIALTSNPCFLFSFSVMKEQKGTEYEYENKPISKPQLILGAPKPLD